MNTTPSNTSTSKTNDSIQCKLADLETMSVGRLLWRYSLPAVTGMVVVSLYNVIDRIFIGQGVGPEAISGLAITFPVMNLATAFGVLIGAGASARISIMLGAKRLDRAQLILGNALTLTLLIATIYVCCFGIFLKDILVAFGASAQTLPYAYDFMLYLIPGLLLTNLTFSFNNIQRASGYPRRAMITMLLSALANLILAPIFIFWLDLGIKGAAIATDLSMLGAMVFVMLHFVDKRSTVHFRRGTFHLDRSVVVSIISIGAAPALVNAAACLINFLINAELVKRGGDMAVGAAGIFSTVTQLVVMVVLGICQGMQPIVGYNYGAGKLHRLKHTYWLAVGASTALCVLGSAVGLLFPGLIARVFTVDTELIQVTANALSHALLAFSLAGFQIVSTNFFQSIGQVGKSIFLGLSRQVIFLIPMLLTLPSLWGLNGVWLSFPMSDISATVITAIFIIVQFRTLDRANNDNNMTARP
ncbi:MAG: MATE family efflux transporter [Muribaculaceae bacterium]|nr:MATE family efflux transporter [Muribaculaceae bacterium]